MRAGVALLATAMGASALRAQSVEATGRVAVARPDGAPGAGAWVVLHEVSQRGEGRPVDSARADARGRYRLRVARAAEGTVYQASTAHLGIGYFSEPQRPQGGRLAFSPIIVYDTASGGPPLTVVHRLLTVARARDDGTRPVLELVELQNAATTIRIAPDTAHPVWAGSLPAVAVQFQAGAGDVSPDAVVRREGRVELYAPVAPGLPKQIAYGYTLPAGVRRVDLPIDSGTGRLSLLLEDTTAQIAGAPLASLGIQDLEDRRFAIYALDSVASVSVVAILLPAGGMSPARLVPVIVGLAAAALVAGLVVALRRRPGDGGRGKGRAALTSEHQA